MHARLGLVAHLQATLSQCVPPMHVHTLQAMAMTHDMSMPARCLLDGHDVECVVGFGLVTAGCHGP